MLTEYSEWNQCVVERAEVDGLWGGSGAPARVFVCSGSSRALGSARRAAVGGGRPRGSRTRARARTALAPPEPPGARRPPHHPRPLNPTRSIFRHDYNYSCNILRRTAFCLHHCCTTHGFVVKRSSSRDFNIYGSIVRVLLRLLTSSAL